jgi:hypothetical protein
MPDVALLHERTGGIDWRAGRHSVGGNRHDVVHPERLFLPQEHRAISVNRMGCFVRYLGHSEPPAALSLCAVVSFDRYSLQKKLYSLEEYRKKKITNLLFQAQSVKETLGLL